jgi:hypothetical protein
MTITDDAPAPPPAAPEPLIKGAFALFLTPAGDVVVAYRLSGTEEDQRLVIPRFILDMAQSASGMTPADLLAKVKAGALNG